MLDAQDRYVCCIVSCCVLRVVYCVLCCVCCVLYVVYCVLHVVCCVLYVVVVLLFACEGVRAEEVRVQGHDVCVRACGCV